MSQPASPPLTPVPPAQKPALQPSRPNRRFASLRAIGALILREMATTYGRSPGGYAWALIEPVVGTAVLTSAESAGLLTTYAGQAVAVSNNQWCAAAFAINGVAA